MKRPTIADLQAKIRDLLPYQELFYCRKEKPIKLKSGEHKIEYWGSSRASGGVIVYQEILVDHALDWCHRVEHGTILGARHDPYLRSLASQIRQAHKEALERRAG